MSQKARFHHQNGGREVRPFIRCALKKITLTKSAPEHIYDNRY